MGMEEKTLSTPQGTIHYWRDTAAPPGPTLVFLPGLTADHRLFRPQAAYFSGRYPLLTWDAPGHGASRPFRLDFSLRDKGAWLGEILAREGIDDFFLVGQSMGGYVAQAFLAEHPGAARGFVSIDSAPLNRKYVTAPELWLLKHCQPLYQCYPWRALQKASVRGNAETEHGRETMREMLAGYTRAEFCRLAGHGYRILAQAMEADLAPAPSCPTLLLCGRRDRAGSTRRYNRAWAAGEGLPLRWLPRAGHCANLDDPDEVNRAIEAFVAQRGN